MTRGQPCMDPLPGGIQHLAHNANVNIFINEMNTTWDALAVAQLKQAKHYNQGRCLEEFEEGDEVLVNPHSLELVDVQGVGQKLVQCRIGPFRVSEKINNSVYCIELPPEYQMHLIINQEHLTKYRQRDPSKESQQLPELCPLASEEVYKVDWIMGHKKIGKKGILYQVRWKEYGPEEDTYEPEANLWNAFSRLRDYRANASLVADSPSL
jgi:hypothetical protein